MAAISQLLLEDHYLITRLAFIGTRDCDYDTPIGASALKNADYAASRGYIFISGGARGVDSIAHHAYGARKALGMRSPEQYIFPAKFGMDLYAEDREAWNDFAAIAEECHPNWDAVRAKGWYVVNLMVRNVMIVWYADAVLAWPYPGRPGGTDHGIAVAKYLNRPLEIMLP